MTNKLVTDGRISSKLDADIRFSLDSIFRDISRLLNELTDTVMAKVNHSAAITADALVKTGPVVYRGFTITAATAAGTIDIRDSASAGAGVIIDTIPATTAAGTRVQLNPGRICETGLYVDYNAGPATGTCIIDFEAL